MEAQLQLKEETIAKLRALNGALQLHLIDMVTTLARDMYVTADSRDAIEKLLGDIWFIERLLHMTTPPGGVSVNPNAPSGSQVAQ